MIFQDTSSKLSLNNNKVTIRQTCKNWNLNLIEFSIFKMPQENEQEERGNTEIKKERTNW